MKRQIAEHFGSSHGESEPMTHYDVYEHVYQEHLSMCLMVWKNYPMDWSEVMANSAMLNRFLAGEIMRPKSVGWPNDSIEFILRQIAQINLMKDYDHSKGNFEQDYRKLMQPPWERE